MEFVEAKTIIGRGYADGWFGADYSMNIYRGCNHGCIYCDSRSLCYQLPEFDRVRGKKDSTKKIRSELKSKRRIGVVATGAMSDPYNPFERKFLLTREALKAVRDNHFGIAIATKSDLIIRDIDLLCEIAQNAPVIIKLTITAADDSISKIIEPRVSLSSERLKALKMLKEAGLYAGVLMMPLLPWINDDPKQVEELVYKIAQTGADFIYPAFGLTMRDGQREYFYGQLDNHYPTLREKYERRFGDRYQCGSPKAKNIDAMFKPLCRKLGLETSMRKIIVAYKKPYEVEQTSLF